MDDTDVADRIEKRVLLHAAHARVWQAISDAQQFGAWFGVRFDGVFAAGARLTGHITPTTVDAEVAKTQQAYAEARFEIVVERIEPMRLFSFRWHPFAVQPDFDYSSEPMTLVTFELSHTAEGTLVTITESGFNGVNAARRARAFQANDAGWTAQTMLLQKYLSRQAPA